MTSPWRGTTPQIASQNDSRYETPGGAQAKADKAEQDAKDYTDAKFDLPELPIQNESIVERHYRTESVSERAIAKKAITRIKIGTGAVGSQELDPTLLQNYGDIAVQSEFEKRLFNVQKFGAKGDGITDDTQAIEDTLRAAIVNGGGIIFFPQTKTPYMVTHLHVYDAKNITFTCPMGTELKIINGSDYGGANVAEIFDLLRCENIVIENFILNGNRYNLNYNVPGYIGDGTAHGIVLESCDRIFIRNVISKDNGTDGIATRFFVSNIYIDRSIFTNSRRNNMSVTRETDGLYVTNTEFSNANGTAPQAGVDIEPTGDGRTLQNIVFNSCKFTDNKSSGLLCDFRMTNKFKNMTVNNCVFSNNTEGSIAVPLRNTATSENIKIINCKLDGYINFSNPTTSTVKHSNIEISGCYTTGFISIASMDGCVIEKNTINRSSGGEEILVEKDLSNILISNNILKSTTNAGIRRTTEGALLSNITISKNNISNKTTLRAIMLIGTVSGIDNVVITENKIYNNSEVAIQLMNATNGIIANNLIHHNSTGLRMESSSNISVNENTFYSNSTSNIHSNTSWNGNIVRNNRGIVTESSGTTTLVSGTTFISVTVPNSITLRIQDLIVTPTTSLGTATKFWVSNVGTNTFRINVDASPGTNLDFSWTYIRL